MSGPRDRYPEVCEASRVFAEAVLADKTTTPAQLRVALALAYYLTMFSRLSDNLARKLIAEKARVSEKSVSRALAKWSGLLQYEPGSNRGSLSFISLRGTDSCPPSGLVRATNGASKGDKWKPEGGHPGCPATEYSEVSERTNPTFLHGSGWVDDSKAEKQPVWDYDDNGELRRVGEAS